MGKEENAGYQHFLLFPQRFDGCSPSVVETWDCLVKELNCLNALKLITIKQSKFICE